MNEEKPQVVIIAGPNGAGKSTLAPFLLRDTLDLKESRVAMMYPRRLSSEDMLEA
jgi:HrpA-like RNA helicase